MPEELILNKIRQVRSRLTVQRYFQTLAQLLFYGSLACLPVLLVDSLTTFNIHAWCFSGWRLALPNRFGCSPYSTGQSLRSRTVD